MVTADVKKPSTGRDLSTYSSDWRVRTAFDQESKNELREDEQYDIDGATATSSCTSERGVFALDRPVAKPIPSLRAEGRQCLKNRRNGAGLGFFTDHKVSSADWKKLRDRCLVRLCVEEHMDTVCAKGLDRTVEPTPARTMANVHMLGMSARTQVGSPTSMPANFA